jgi:hypothetical protein
MMLEIPYPVELRAVVQVQAERAHSLGLASVRYCTRRGAHFLVGLEFTPGFRWPDLPAPGGAGA